MAEYIEREALTAELAKGTIITDDIYGMGIMAGIDFALKTARSIPTADVVERKRGEWEWYDRTLSQWYIERGYRCSACGFEQEDETNFCPNCGAKMDGEADKNVGHTIPVNDLYDEDGGDVMKEKEPEG